MALTLVTEECGPKTRNPSDLLRMEKVKETPSPLESPEQVQKMYSADTFNLVRPRRLMLDF